MMGMSSLPREGRLQLADYVIMCVEHAPNKRESLRLEQIQSRAKQSSSMTTLPTITFEYVQSLALGGTAHTDNTNSTASSASGFKPIVPIQVTPQYRWNSNFCAFTDHARSVQLHIACCFSWSTLPLPSIPIACKDWQRVQVRGEEVEYGTSVRCKGRPGAGTHKVYCVHCCCCAAVIMILFWYYFTA